MSASKIPTHNLSIAARMMDSQIPILYLILITDEMYLGNKTCVVYSDELYYAFCEHQIIWFGLLASFFSGMHSQINANAHFNIYRKI